MEILLRQLAALGNHFRKMIFVSPLILRHYIVQKLPEILTKES